MILSDKPSGQKKESSWAIVSEDPNAQRWYELAQFGFWLRHPAALRAVSANIPEGLVDVQERFRRLGWELTVLESDLTQCINEFKAAYQALYAAPRDLFLKKFSIVYHTDNFYVRVHKLIDNTWQLVGLAAGFQSGPKAKDRPIRREVENALSKTKCQKIASLLRTFEENKRIRQSVEARHLFVHHYRDEPRWSLLNARRRFEETGGDEDIQAREIRQFTEASDLDRYADRKADELFETLYAIRDFRDQLHSVFVDCLVKLASNMPPEVKVMALRVVTGLSTQEILERLGEDKGSP